MKKYLLPSALILALGLAIASAANITKSVQLSQDPSGPVGVDTSNNVYFPAHILTTNRVPTVNTGSGTAATIDSNSTDFMGKITGGGATTGAVSAVFNTAYAAAPICLIAQSGGTASTLAYNTAATGINITSIVGTGIFNYACSGRT